MYMHRCMHNIFLYHTLQSVYMYVDIISCAQVREARCQGDILQVWSLYLQPIIVFSSPSMFSLIRIILAEFKKGVEGSTQNVKPNSEKPTPNKGKQNEAAKESKGKGKAKARKRPTPEPPTETPVVSHRVNGKKKAKK